SRRPRSCSPSASCSCRSASSWSFKRLAPASRLLSSGRSPAEAGRVAALKEKDDNGLNRSDLLGSSVVLVVTEVFFHVTCGFARSARAEFLGATSPTHRRRLRRSTSRLQRSHRQAAGAG